MDNTNDEFTNSVLRSFAYKTTTQTSEKLKPKSFSFSNLKAWLIYFLTSIPVIFSSFYDDKNSPDLIKASKIEASEILRNTDFRKDFHDQIKKKSKDKILTEVEFLRMSIDAIRQPEISEKYLIPQQPMLYACLISQIKDIGINDLI